MPPAPRFDRSALAAVLTRQHGVITRAQALRLGMTGTAVQYRVHRGRAWQVLLPGVYLAHSGRASDDQRDIAALLYGGPASVITGSAALRRHGLRAIEPTGIDVLVPPGIQRRDTGFIRLHRTKRMPALHCYCAPVRYALAARAVADAARLLPRLEDVRAIVAGAVQQGLCPVERVADEVAGGPMRGSAALRQALAEVADGVRSAAEADLHTLIKRAGLPEPMFNPRLFAGREFLAAPDCWWPASGLAVEVDSRAWHLSPESWEATLARHARMSSHGILVLHFTPRQIRVRPREAEAAIRQALAAGRAIPGIRAVPAT